MPNAQTHLAAACDLLAQPAVITAFPALSGAAAQAAFLLGAIGPDVRAMSGHSREATHFFEIPPADERPAQVMMFEAYPELADFTTLPPEQAAFIAGYVTHLVMDETWLRIVVMPGLFIDGMPWGTEHPNWWAYSLLMTWLEYRAADRLCEIAILGLSVAQPHHWLPFVTDDSLRRWRDHVAGLIGLGGARLVSAMFAHTNDISPAELEAIVLDDARMEVEAFSVVSRERLRAFEAETAQHSESAVVTYFTHS
jgi:hypothetical protein